MPPMPSTEYNASQKQRMLEHVRAAIARELGYKLARCSAEEPWQKEERAAFVTLNHHGQLRGCIGSLSAHQSLWDELSYDACAAAFRDRRFAPLSRDEFDDLDIHISILTPTQPLAVDSEQALLSALRPGVDGLVLEEGVRRATFLPQVWEQLPEPKRFLEHLKRKAGLAEDYWSDTMQFSIYQVTDIGE